jgi:adenine-specific DNA-methyltransferase
LKRSFFDDIEGKCVFNINTSLEFVTQKNFLDNSYTRFRNNYGLTICRKYLQERGEVILDWADKDCVVEGITPAADLKSAVGDILKIQVPLAPQES